MMQSLVNSWNEFYHNTQPENFLNIRTRYIFQRAFSENIGDFTELHNEKISIWVSVNGIVSVARTRVNVYQIL